MSVPCPVCRSRKGTIKCSGCNGLGETYLAAVAKPGERSDGHPWVYTIIPCAYCNGQGKKVCYRCFGTGEVLPYSPPPYNGPPPLDTAEFNKQKRLSNIKRAAGPEEKRDEIHGWVIPVMSMSKPSELLSRNYDEPERKWIASLKRSQGK